MNKNIIKKAKPVPGKVRWQAGSDDIETGLKFDDETGQSFVPWKDLKKELEKNLLIYLGRIFGDKKIFAKVADWNGRKDWVMRIVDEEGKELGSIWLGGDPENGWKWDGLVRVGKTKNDSEYIVWQIFERYSDGSYSRIVAKDTPDNRP